MCDFIPVPQIARGGFLFSQNFREFRFIRKWETFRWFVPMENSRKKQVKVGPFSRLELSERNFDVPFTRFSYFIPVSIVTKSAAILVSHRVICFAPFRGLRTNGTTFCLSENLFLFPLKFPDFLPKWKAHSMYIFSKIQLVVYYQCCVLIGCGTTRLYVFVIAHQQRKARAYQRRKRIKVQL